MRVSIINTNNINPLYHTRYEGFYLQNYNNSPTFSAMKKSQFDGVDFAAVEKYKAPIEKFNTNDDLQEWAEEQYTEIKTKDYPGKHIDNTYQRKRYINEWASELEKNDYSPVEKLIIMKDLTKNLKKTDTSNLPLYNSEILTKTMTDFKSDLKKDKKITFDFGKNYKNNLKDYYINLTKYGDNETKWIVIPSKRHDPENFKTNVEKLQSISLDSWCTKDERARVYLSDGDFHLFMEKGIPRLCIKFNDDVITEIQGPLNNNRINPKYFDILKNHIKENDYILEGSAVPILNISERLKGHVEKINKELGKAIKNNDKEKIFNYFGIDVKHDKNNEMILSDYYLPEGLYYSDLGIDENELFKNVIKIEGCADFTNSELSSTHNLKEVCGNATFTLSKIKTLPHLEKINGNAVFTNSKLEETGAIKSVKNLILKDSKVKKITNVEKVHETLDMRQSLVEDIGKITSVGRNFYSSPFLESLNNLKYIGNDADFSYSCNSLTNLGMLEYIGGNCKLSNIKIDSLDSLKIIEGNASFENAKIKTLGNLTTIGGDADFSRAKINDTGNLKEIGGKLIVPKYSVDDYLYSKLKEIKSPYVDPQTEEELTLKDFLSKFWN